MPKTDHQTPADALTHLPLSPSAAIGKTYKSAPKPTLPRTHEEGMENGFVIEKNIPLPQRASSVQNNYPFDQMEPGDSFFCPCPKGKDVQSLRKKLGSAFRHWRRANKRPDLHHATRAEENPNGISGLRFWLLAKE